jgi:dTDP-4-amino-4,6-dideoxygalactose transaminase
MGNLAINGGYPVAPFGLRTRWPVYDESDIHAVLEVLTSGKWCALGHTTYSKNGQFERAFADYLGVDYGILVDNGTDAIALALKAGGINVGDEVIVPAVTFVATATAVLQVNGVPIFADIDPETYQIDPAAIRKLITNRTKAIVPVHYGGYPADMDEIMKIAEENNLLVVEDCAEAHGSEWNGKRVGTIGHLGTFSFQQGKPLTCGEGGFVCTDDKELASRCVSYSNFGRIAGKPVYEHYWMGWNMRATEFQAALLLSQLKRLPKQTQIRHANGKYLAFELEKIDGVSALKRDPRITNRGYYFFLMRYDLTRFENVSLECFIKALNSEGIPVGKAHNQPLYNNPLFKEMHFSGIPHMDVDYTNISCPVAERIYKNEIVALGKDFLMERENIDLVLKSIIKIRENINELV